jgi:hypothetical protein
MEPLQLGRTTQRATQAHQIQIIARLSLAGGTLRADYTIECKSQDDIGSLKCSCTVWQCQWHDPTCTFPELYSCMCLFHNVALQGTRLGRGAQYSHWGTMAQDAL